ncbi:MAG: hypothetical protein HDQ97_11355 [Lachnospiraceae bacterium]|nr:hypothetical protein [Lachnospiraceae bacterium]
MHLISGPWQKIGKFTYGMVDNQGKIAMNGDFRRHKAGCRPAPPRPSYDTYIHSVSEIRFGDWT